MTLSDIAVRRPMVAFVASALIIVFGILGLRDLPLRELPDVDQPVVSINADFPGANAEIVENRVTEPLEAQLSGIDGIEEISSRSEDGDSRISVTFSLARDLEAAANDVRDAVSQARRQLPQDVEEVRVDKQDSDARPFMWYNLMSETMTAEELTDYADRFLLDRLTIIDGVTNVSIGGNRRYAMRIWLNPSAMAARQVTAADIENAIRAENIEVPGGSLETAGSQIAVRVERVFSNPESFARLPVRTLADGQVIRLGEVADVELSAEEPRAMFRGNQRSMIGLGFVRQSQSNAVAVASAIHEEMDRIRAQLPEGMELIVANDETVFIRESIREVWLTLGVAATLVVLVIYLFLGNLRSAIVPAAVVPVCLIGTFAVLSAFGFSLNILTLLALVLAIGLVVDDSIVVIENIQRRVDLGEPPITAALNGGRQVFFAVIATTATLVAVFVPLVFLPGLIGRLFTELAVAIAGAVILSSFVALTLSPMMASKLARPSVNLRGPARWADSLTNRLRDSYISSLKVVVKAPWIVAPLVILSVAGSIFMFSQLPSELTPDEDRGSFFGRFSAQEGASFEFTSEQALILEDMLMDYVEAGELRRLLIAVPGFGGGGGDFSSGIVVGSMVPQGERRAGQEIINEMNARLGELTGVRAFVTMRGGLGGGGGGDDVEVVLLGSDYDQLNAEAEAMVQAIQATNPNLQRPRKNFEPNAPRLIVEIDRERAGALGVSVAEVGRTLQTHLGARRVGQFIERGESYNVIMENRSADRSGGGDLESLYVRARGGELIALSNLVALRETGESSTRNRLDRQRAVAVSATLSAGYTLGEAVAWLDAYAADNLPADVSTQYTGSARDFLDSSNAILFAFAMALLIVFLVLAAQFESFIQPAVIMLTVPLAVAGGLFGLYMAGSSLNIYSQIGLIILIGLAAKNGILIVEFANQVRDEGKSVLDATLDAAGTRFRPILMTGISTAIGALPLMLASGPGAENRVTIGVVIFTGVMVATLFTLFVIPAVYAAVGRYTKTPNWVSRQLAREAEQALPKGSAAPAE